VYEGEQCKSKYLKLCVYLHFGNARVPFPLKCRISLTQSPDKGRIAMDLQVNAKMAYWGARKRDMKNGTLDD